MRIAMSLFVLAICALIGFVGCSGDKEGGFNPFLSGSGTGVRGLDTPDQILSNPYVADALDAASAEGVNITPEQGVNPPVISGAYNFTGEAIVPGWTVWYTLTPGTWRWYNQTADHHIDTEYDQIGMQTGSGGGEIIRGTGSSFTVYSILEINDVDMGGCEERAVAIVDGVQDGQGNVTADYVITPAQEPLCHATTVGRLELTLTGSAKAAVNGGDGGLLIKILREALEQPGMQHGGSK